MVVVFHPPFAERELQDEERHSGQQACRDAQIVVQGKAPVVIKHSSGHALGDVVRQAHFAVWDDFAHERLHPGTVKGHQPARDQYQHESEFIQRTYHKAQRGQHGRIADEVRQHVAKPVQREKCNQGSAKYLVPHFQVFFQEQAPSADEQSEEE